MRTSDEIKSAPFARGPSAGGASDVTPDLRAASHKARAAIEKSFWRKMRQKYYYN